MISSFIMATLKGFLISLQREGPGPPFLFPGTLGTHPAIERLVLSSSSWQQIQFCQHVTHRSQHSNITDHKCIQTRSNDVIDVTSQQGAAAAVSTCPVTDFSTSSLVPVREIVHGPLLITYQARDLSDIGQRETSQLPENAAYVKED